MLVDVSPLLGVTDVDPRAGVTEDVETLEVSAHSAFGVVAGVMKPYEFSLLTVDIPGVLDPVENRGVHPLESSSKTNLKRDVITF